MACKDLDRYQKEKRKANCKTQGGKWNVNTCNCDKITATESSKREAIRLREKWWDKRFNQLKQDTPPAIRKTIEENY